ncbi:MAG: DNA gyrase subunit A, partial [Gemmatimonadetes bacterium]|nr:DNA gyrase subunit A [Gemmatimonadota bacterium]
VLPAKLPNLLVNGSSGIAVGMATNIPPHNLREVAAAVRHLVAHPDCTVDDLFRHLPGPDFPTGGFVLGVEGIHQAYRTGRGRIVMRARVQKETKRGGKEQLVVTELPYGVSKSKVVEQIAELVRLRKLEDVSDLRDESDRDGMRIVIELKRGAKPQPILNMLYKHTYLQATFGAIMLALDHGRPREMTLKEMLERYRDHRLEVIQRRTRFDLEKAKEEAHIVEGLLIALDHIDAVIAIIRKSKDRADASAKLRQRFELSEAQADAILNMRLAKLTSLETQELRDELEALRARIAELERILESPKRQLEVLITELDEVVAQFGDARRTTILKGDAELAMEDLVAQEDVVITMSHQGYIKRVPMDLYRRRLTRGKALAGMDRYEDDFLEHVFVANTHETLVFFTTTGQALALPVLDVPEAGRASRGKAFYQLLNLDRSTEIAALVSVTEFSPERSLLFLTAGGTVKRTTLDQFANIRAGGIAAIKLQPRDRLLDVQLSDGTNDVVLVTRNGRAIRFPETEVPLMGRVAQGVAGIKMKEGDRVVGMVVVRREATLCTVTTQGYAKRTPVTDYPVQRRGGLGTLTLEVTEKSGKLVAAKELLEGDELMIITAGGGAMRVAAADIPEQGRTTQGKQVIAPIDGDRVVEVARVAKEREDGSGGGGAVESEEDQLELIAEAGEA